MRLLSIILWVLLCVCAALLFVAALFIHASVMTFLIAAAVFALCVVWWHDEIKYKVL